MFFLKLQKKNIFLFPADFFGPIIIQRLISTKCRDALKKMGMTLALEKNGHDPSP
jgi:hypothetical protein